MDLILRTPIYSNLEWTGNDKKTANVNANQFVFEPTHLPDFSEIYSKPEQFKIRYRDENGTYREVLCNYVANGQTRYTFSYKIDNDVINLSVFKSDGHLEINVRNQKLEYPMDLSNVAFDVISFFNIAYVVDGPGRVVGDDTALADAPFVIQVIPNDGCRLIDITAGDDETEYDVIKEAGSDTRYYIQMPKEINGEAVFINANFEEIQPVEEYPIELYNYQHCNPTVEPNTYIQGETTFTITVNPEEGYELDYVLIQNLDGVTDYYRGTELTHLAEWSGEPDPMMPENPWGYRVSVVCKEIPGPTEYTLRVVNGEPAEITTAPGTNVDIFANPAPEGKEFDKWVVSGTEEEVVANIYARETVVNVLVDGIVVTATYKDIPEPPVPTEGDLIFTTTFNRYAIVDVLVKEDGSAGVVNVRRMTETDVDLDDTYETVLRAACTFRQDLIVSVEVIMNKPDNVPANYTVNSTRILINGEEL